MSQQPPRHGHGGFSTIPVPTGLQRARGQQSSLQDVTEASTGERVQLVAAADVIPARLVHQFLSALPHPSIQQTVLHRSILYDPTWVADQLIILQSLQVPSGMVQVFTDIVFFATAPGQGLQAPSRRIPDADLAGLLRFDVRFNGRTPMELEGYFISPTAGVNRNIGQRSGWPWLERVFGTQRESAFAVYAREGATIEASAVIDVVPQFPLTSLGVELHGFTVSLNVFEDSWKTPG